MRCRNMKEKEAKITGAHFYCKSCGVTNLKLKVSGDARGVEEMILEKQDYLLAQADETHNKFGMLTIAWLVSGFVVAMAIWLTHGGC